MRDDQRERYARHIALPEIGERGQEALLAANARLSGTEPADRIAAAYLAAAGVGVHAGRDVVVSPRPAWWPDATGDDLALAFWRGAIAATQWIDDAIRE